MRAVCWEGTENIRVETVTDPVMMNPRDANVKVTTTAISAMECRSTMCKAVFTHQDRAAQEAFSGSERYLDLIQPFAQSFFVHDRGGAAGAASTVVFLSRDQGGLVAHLDSLPKATEKP